MSSSTLGSAAVAGAVAAAVPLALAAFRRWAPPADAGGHSLRQLRDEFGSRWDVVATALWLASAAAVVAGTWLALTQLGRLVGPRPAGDGGFVVQCNWILYAFAGFVLALGTAWVPPLLALRLLLGRPRYARFIAFQNLKSGFRVQPVMLAALVLMGLAAGALSYLLLNSYTIVDRDGIRFARVGQFQESRYRYEQVEAILHAQSFVSGGRDGGTVHRPAWAVLFDDGEYVTTIDLIFRVGDEEAARIMRYVAEHAGVDVQDVQTLGPALRPHT